MKMSKIIFVVALILCMVLSFGNVFASGKEKEAVPEETAPKEKVVLRFTDFQGGNEGIPVCSVGRREGQGQLD